MHYTTLHCTALAHCPATSVKARASRLTDCESTVHRVLPCDVVLIAGLSRQGGTPGLVKVLFRDACAYGVIAVQVSSKIKLSRALGFADLKIATGRSRMRLVRSDAAIASGGIRRLDEEC